MLLKVVQCSLHLFEVTLDTYYILSKCSVWHILDSVNKIILVHIVLEPKCMLNVCINFLSEHLTPFAYPSFL